MSTQYTRSEDVPTEALALRLRELAAAAVEGKTDEFLMRIPAEVDHGADLVMAESARRLRRLDVVRPVNIQPPVPEGTYFTRR